jgi:antitoxin ChpS
MTIPKPILDALGLASNEKVSLQIEDGRLIVGPRVRPRYALDDLIAQCNFGAEPNTETRDWDSAGPVGREAI